MKYPFFDKINIKRAQNYRYRQGVIKYFFALLLIVFAFRLVTVHQLEAGDISLQQYGEKQSHNQQKIQMHRGDILDRNNEVLASSLLLKKINLDPTLFQAEFIPELSRALMMSEAQLQTAISKKLSQKTGRRNLIIKKNIPPTSPILQNIKRLRKKTCVSEMRQNLSKFDKMLIAINLKKGVKKTCEKPKKNICRHKKTKIKPNFIRQTLIWLNFKKDTYEIRLSCQKEHMYGVALQKDISRYYPKSASLAPLLGRINHKKIGAFGIESEFETVLSERNKITQLRFDKNTHGSYFNKKTIQKPKQGRNINLTIDSDMQFHTYAALKKSVKKHNADSGSAIILAANGEILALANYPADDPNDRRIYNAENYRNHALTDKVEPGSTMKPFTMLLALDQGKINATEDEKIDVTKRIGHIKPDGKYHKMTIKKILQKSHNLGTVKVADRLSKKILYNTWKKLGFGQPLGLLPSIESAGTLRHFSHWSATDKHTLSFGHGPMQTNLAQLAHAYLVFANQGAIPNLKLIKGAYTDEMTSVFSPKSTVKIAKLLDSVASKEGSGYRAQIKGYAVAGKTGTAEMVIDGVYNKKGAKRTFFVGFTPVNLPKYIMAVQLNYPKKCYTSYNPTLRNKCQGSNSAAIVFKDAMQNILNFGDSASEN